MIVFDIDGTLSIVGDRLKYLEQVPKDWDSFYEACGEDVLNTQVAKTCWELSYHNSIVFVTGRRERVRQITVDWLAQHNIVKGWLSGDYNKALYMRKSGDFRHDTIVKPELVSDFIYDINLVFEDRNSMVKKWRELGLTCLQVAEGDF